MSTPQQMILSLEKGEYDQAQYYFNKVKKSSNEDEQFQLAEELYQLGFLEESRELYEILLNKYPDEGELQILLAEVLVEMDQEEEALSILEQFSESDSFYPRALLLLADLYQMQGLFEVSEQKLLKARELLPKEPIIDFALAELYMEQGRFSEAIPYYEKILKQGENELAGVDLHQRVAEALSTQGAFEESLPYYEKALENKLEINTLFGFAFTAYQAGFYRTAIEKFTELKQLDPDYHSVYLFLAKCYEHEGQLMESLETIKQGIHHDGFNKELYFLGGKVALKLNEEEEAEKFLREAFSLDPGYMEAALTLNKLLFHQERYEDVIEIIQILMQEGEVDPQLLWDKAKAFNETEQYSLALNAYQEAYTFFNNNQDFLEEYAYFLLEEGYHQKAIELFKTLLVSDPTNDEWISLVERLEN
ncbi:tetratricopeptide (TPR) repeat protein [Oikeobacillus pervagus]|uniref:Tetratricopeptide (TPR) repeat protein n=1 Tax=Oikeobacillus pervagus TaxID=1325931 RepID=A0AAJ1SXR1_9BACI|nr:tetratricopeptide repeat protein [Oikeobacillus pervagus]MDQ0213687.1 tetratricopeptide (TPR) repeat protein [Oikeobacillus pervagus]